MPSPRQGAAFAWDPKDGYLLMFGGSTGDPDRAVFGDTWAWIGSEWLQLHPQTSPPARGEGALGYDPESQRMILYGGGDNFYLQATDPQRNDTWAWDGTNWTELHPAHTPTPAVCCSEVEMAYDEGKPGLWLTLGLLKTWAWTGSDWTLMAPAARPPERFLFGFAYDSELRGTIAVSGYAGEGTAAPGEAAPSHDDTWLWTSGRWVELRPLVNPARGPCVAAFDKARRVLVLFSADGSTWIFDGTTWLKQHALHSPPSGLSGDSIAYDPVTGSVVFFGGADSVQAQPYFNQTWSWDGSDWSRLT